jgi:TPR repeat protein
MFIVKRVLAASTPARSLAIAVAAALSITNSAGAQSTNEIVLRLDNGKTATIFRHTIFRDERGFMHFSIFTFMGDQEFAVNCGTQAWFSKSQGHDQWTPANPLDDAFFRLVCSAQSGDGQRQFDEGQTAYDRGDYAAALRLWTPLAQQSYAKAQEGIGTMYYEGRGVARDYAEAFRWFSRAAEQGDPNAPFYLGVMYHDGLGVAMDRAEAARWYRRAADQGTAIAQVNLGAAYADGDGVARDEAEAVRWYRKAAEQGHALGQNNLAYMYETGRGVVRDRALAIAWYRKAAQQGHTLARNNLSRLEAESGGSASPANAEERLPDRTSDFVRWCDQRGLYAKDSQGWSCASFIGFRTGLTAYVGRADGCAALKSRMGDTNAPDGMERAGAALSSSVLPWLRARVGALTNSASDDILAAIRALYDCSM